MPLVDDPFGPPKSNGAENRGVYRARKGQSSSRLIWGSLNASLVLHHRAALLAFRRSSAIVHQPGSSIAG